MSYYLKYMENILREATVLVNDDSRDEIHEFLKELTRVKSDDWQDVWKVLQPWTMNPHMRQMLVLALKDEFGQV